MWDVEIITDWVTYGGEIMTYAASRRYLAGDVILSTHWQADTPASELIPDTNITTAKYQVDDATYLAWVADLQIQVLVAEEFNEPTTE